MERDVFCTLSMMLNAAIYLQLPLVPVSLAMAACNDWQLNIVA